MTGSREMYRPETFPKTGRRFSEHFKPLGLFPEWGTITFTHGDLHRSNILVSLEDPAQVVAIVDWEQSGWYPEYWEYCKADAFTGWEADGTHWLPYILCPRPCSSYWYEYMIGYGSV